MTQNTPPTYVRAVSEDLASTTINHLNPIEMVLDELDRGVKEKQPTSAQHMWELVQHCWKTIPGDDLMKAGWENAKSVQSCKSKR